MLLIIGVNHYQSNVILIRMSVKTKIVITGVNGFVGEHLARHLKSEGFYVHGVGRESAPNEHVASLLDKYEVADLMDGPSTDSLTLSGAAAIIHLAGLASVSESFKDPELYEKGNAIITDNLLSTAARQSFLGRAVVISTGALYDPAQPMPINEKSAVIESSPYAVGKLRAEAVVRQHKDSGLDAIIVRPFNHIGPHQGPGFLLPDLYTLLKEAQANNSKAIKVGNISTSRDYTDVRDVVVAYTLLATAPVLSYDIYNVASGKSHSGEKIFEALKTVMSIDNIEAEIDPDKIRPTDIKNIVGDASRISDELGWAPIIPLETTIRDFVNES